MNARTSACCQNANLPQRIRFAYNISFDPNLLTAFPTTGSPKHYQLAATLQVQGNPLPYNPLAEFFLLGGADPYFANLREGAEYFFLSQDLRVFTATPAVNPTPVVSPMPVGGTPPPSLTDSFAGAYQYVQDLVEYLNQQIGYKNPTYTPPDTNISDPLDGLLPNQSGALNGDSTVTPLTAGGLNRPGVPAAFTVLPGGLAIAR